MANKKISAATAISTIAMSDMLPIAKSADSTAYFITLGQMMGMGGVMSLSAAVTTGATSISLRSAPAWVANYGGYVVIDVGTTECEIRSLTTYAGTTASFTDALTYNHNANDPVLWVQDPVANVKWFGAKGNDSTNDYTSISRAFTQAGIVGASVYVPSGTYRIGTGLSWVDGMTALIGDRHSTIKATAAITMLTMNLTADGLSNRYLELANLYFDGDDTATKGVLVCTVVECSFRRLAIYDVAGAGMTLSTTQNSNFDRIFVTGSNIGFQLSNGATSNNFMGCHTNESANYGVYFIEDATLPNYTIVNDSNHNVFEKGIFERGAVGNTQLYMKNASRNTFIGTTFTRPDSATAPVAYFHATGTNGNSFLHCRFSANVEGTAPMVENHGDTQRFLDGTSFGGWSGAYNFIETDARIIMSRCIIAADGKISVTAGSVADNVVYEAIRQAGTTAEYPDHGDHFVTDYYDTTLDKPMWYDFNSTTWHDALHGRYTLMNPTVVEIASGAITIANISNYSVDVEGGSDATDDLDTITGGTAGQILMLRAYSDSRTIVLKDTSGNLRIAGDFSLDSARDRILLHYDGTYWCELSRSDNA